MFFETALKYANAALEAARQPHKDTETQLCQAQERHESELRTAREKVSRLSGLCESLHQLQSPGVALENAERELEAAQAEVSRANTTLVDTRTRLSEAREPFISAQQTVDDLTQAISMNSASSAEWRGQRALGTARSALKLARAPHNDAVTELESKVESLQRKWKEANSASETAQTASARAHLATSDAVILGFIDDRLRENAAAEETATVELEQAKAQLADAKKPFASAEQTVSEIVDALARCSRKLEEEQEESRRSSNERSSSGCECTETYTCGQCLGVGGRHHDYIDHNDPTR